MGGEVGALIRSFLGIGGFSGNSEGRNAKDQLFDGMLCCMSKFMRKKSPRLVWAIDKRSSKEGHLERVNRGAHVDSAGGLGAQ